MTDTHATSKPGDTGIIKDIADHAISFALKETAFCTAGDDTTSILATMLQQREALTYLGSHIQARIVKVHTKNAAH